MDYNSSQFKIHGPQNIVGWDGMNGNKKEENDLNKEMNILNGSYLEVIKLIFSF